MHTSLTVLLLLAIIVAANQIWSVSTSSTTSWLSQCSKEGQEELKRLYVSTLDGTLTSLDTTNGKRQWRYKFTQPLYSSTLSYSKPSSQFPNLIPGLDKNLYNWNGIELTRLTLTADDLIERSYAAGPDTVRAGAKSKEDVALDTATGKPLYRCTQFNCEKYDNQSLIGQMDRLLVSAHRTTVREANGLTGEELWNFTVSQLHLSLLEGEKGEEEDISCQLDNEELEWIIHVDSSKGYLFVSDSLSHTSWDFKFPSPVMNVWLHHGGKLEKMSLSPLTLPSEDQPELLLGIWQQQYYIQPTIQHTSPYELSHTFLSNSHGNSCPGNLPSYIPSFPSSLSPTFQHHYSYEKSLALYHSQFEWLKDLSTDGPNGLALYFHVADNDVVDQTCSREENSSDDMTQPISVPILEKPGYLENIYEISKVILKYGLFALCVLVINRLRRHHMQQRRMRRQRLSSSSNSSDDGQLLQQTDELELDSLSPESVFINDRRRTSSVATIKPSSTYDLLPIVEEDEDTPSKNVRSDSTESIGSRFETEYDLLGVLGRGGFGVVYHVKNKIDGSEYALKRIKLPVKKFARDKVMREVHALAQLDHPQIVRYFNSWVERAPPGWDQREEWVSLSRVNSLLQMEDLSSSKPPSPVVPLSFSHSIPNGTIPLSTPLFTNLSSELPPIRQLSSDSRNSSFTIEFREDSHSRISSDERRPISPSSLSSDSASRRALPSSEEQDTSRETSDDEDLQSFSTSTRHQVCSIVDPPTFVFIQMQLCQKESLKDWLKTNIYNRQRNEIWKMFDQILNAVVYVHTKGLMHRDLKPSNIFFSLDGSVKVGDFGLVTGNITPDTHRNSFISLKHLGDDQLVGSRHTGNIGTHFYVSPEQLKGLQYDQKVDIFSLGVILFELNYPFLTEMERAKVLEDLRKTRFPKGFKRHLRQEAQFVEWLMSPVNKRPSALEVYKSDRLDELKDIVNYSDFTFIPKL